PHYVDAERQIVTDNSLDPTHKDVVDLLLRLCAREGLRMTPQIHLSGPVPELETLAARDPDIVIAPPSESSAPKGSSPRYNFAHPAVQRVVQNVVLELAQRYGRHPACAGIAVQLGPECYTSANPGSAAGAKATSFTRFYGELSKQLANRPTPVK